MEETLTPYRYVTPVLPHERFRFSMIHEKSYLFFKYSIFRKGEPLMYEKKKNGLPENVIVPYKLVLKMILSETRFDLMKIFYRFLRPRVSVFISTV